MCLDISIIGEPAPDVVWSQNGKSIQQTSNRHIDNIPYNTKYINANPERKDTGLYKIVATNKYGQDQVEFQINIISMYICSQLCKSGIYLTFVNIILVYFSKTSRTRRSIRSF